MWLSQKETWKHNKYVAIIYASDLEDHRKRTDHQKSYLEVQDRLTNYRYSFVITLFLPLNAGNIFLLVL